MDTLIYALDLIEQGVLSVDDAGRVWRHKVRKPSGWYRTIEKRRAESVGGKGYLTLVLWTPDKRCHRVGAHRVVWCYFNKVRSIPKGVEVNHIDLDKTNNHPDNLELLTPSGNTQHAYDNGRTHPWGKRGRTGEWRPGSGKLVITDEQREDIRRLRSSGAKLKDISAQYGIGTSQVHRICAENKEAGG